MRNACSLLLLCGLLACARSTSRMDSGSVREASPAATAPSPVVQQAADREGAKSDTSAQAADEGLDALLKEYEEDAPSEERTIADPIKPWNVVWYYFNDKLYFWILKPVSKGYGFVLYPRFIRRGIRNFIINIGFPGRFFNTALQGRWKHSGSEIGRFLVNITVGGLGFWDPATHWLNMKRYDEDFDQTLGVWGMGMAFYLTWPLSGPSSVRGTLGLVADNFLDPIRSYWAVTLLERLNAMSLDIDPYPEIKKMSVDPYVAIRNGYVQSREQAIKDRGGQ